MSASSLAAPHELPPAVRDLLAELVASAQECLQDDLRSIVLFGSGAEGRLRATSDVNVLFVLTRFDKERMDALGESLRLAHVAARVAVMFVLEAELPVAAEAFAVKFDDIARRHRVLYGEDPIAKLTVSRESRKTRLRQTLLNLTLRLRNQYATRGLREEQLAIVIADAAGPLRSAAATLLELEGKTVASPRQALETAAAEILGGDGPQVLQAMSQARVAPPAAGRCRRDDVSPAGPGRGDVPPRGKGTLT